MKYRILSEQSALLEATKHGKAWKVMVIEEGMSKNGKFYPAEVLKKAVSLFDKAKAFFYEWKDGEYNHLPPTIQRMRPEGFPKQIAGWYSDPQFEEVEIDGEMKRGITALFHVHEGANWLREMLRDAWMNGMKRLLGLSIDADGKTETRAINGRPIEVVTSIEKVFGVDLVSHPAAGGQFVRLLASKMKEGEMDRAKLIEMLKKLRPELLEGVNVDELQEAELEKLLAKAMQEDDADAQKKALAERAKAVGLPETATEAQIVEAEKAKKDEEEKKKKKKEEDDDMACESKVQEAVDVEVKKAQDRAKADGLNEAETMKLVEEAKGQATLNQVIGLLKGKKYALAMNVLQKWMSAYPKASPYKKEAEELMKKISAMDDKLAISECGKILDKHLKESRLPDIVKKKVEKRFSGTKFDEKSLQEALKEETDILASLAKEGDVDLGEFADVHVGRTGMDRLQASLDLMLDPKVDDNEKAKYEGMKPFSSLREAYVRITGDMNVSGVIPPKRLQEATSGDFTYMLGNTLNRRMAKEYKLTPAMWRDLAETTNLKDFKQQEVIRWGGFASLEVVAESDTTDYPNIAFPGDEEATYSPSTRGGIVKITRRMIINDDLRSLQKLPNKLARAAVMTLNQFVFDLLLNYGSGAINGGTIYDTLALYHANHFNLSTGALDYDTYGDALDRLMEQKEYGYATTILDNPLTNVATTINVAAGKGSNFKAGDYVILEAEIVGPIVSVTVDALDVTGGRGALGTTAAAHVLNTPIKIVTDDLMLTPGYLWVPTDLRTEGEAILLAEKKDDTLNNRNPYYKSAELRTVPRKYMRGDTTNWFVTAKKSDIEMMEIGFLGGKEEPELIRQDAPGVGLVFTRDVISYKVRHEYGGAVVDFRGFQGAIV